MNSEPSFPTEVFPLLVPSGHPSDLGSVVVPLVEGLDVTLVTRRPGTIRGVHAEDLQRRGWSVRQAHARALENLEGVAVRGEARAMALPFDDDRQCILWGGHWLSATFALLPALWKNANAALAADSLLLSVPHRGAMFVFEEGDAAWRRRMNRTVRELEGDGPKPISFDLLRLHAHRDPYYERSPISWYEE